MDGWMAGRRLDREAAAASEAATRARPGTTEATAPGVTEAEVSSTAIE